MFEFVQLYHIWLNIAGYSENMSKGKGTHFEKSASKNNTLKI